MVYRGKPGLGCDLCRKRRLTCDRQRPSCSQCIRIHQKCTGYRDPNMLRVFDQTEEVSQKVEARRRASRKNSPTSSQGSITPARLSPPPLSIDDHAMSHLFTFWVGSGQSQGILWYVPELLCKESSVALQAASRALGLASMSGMQETSNLGRSAAESYGMALCATNDALRDPALATTDSTLTAVMMLSTYEMIMGKMGRHEMHGWMNHILGATRMLELRGEAQMDSELGRFLFETVTLLNAISGVLFRYSKHNSQRIWELSELAETKDNQDAGPRERFYRIIVRLNDLSIKVDRAEKSAENLGSLLSEALVLEAELEAWCMSLDDTWSYAIVKRAHASTHEHFCSATGRKTYHTYNSLAIAGMWNFYRQMRIILNEMIRSIADYLLGFQWTYEGEQIVFQSISAMDQLADDICASIDYYFIYGAPGVGGVLRLQLPLFVAALCTDKYSERYTWILQMLDMLATLTGFEQTNSLSQRLRNSSNRGILPSIMN